ncbi:rhodanese-like domain-containing protein [Cesiribacter andamanensis]|nr:rhodanese-like domain-containing protein [Cesiribacter andamanensis]
MKKRLVLILLPLGLAACSGESAPVDAAPMEVGAVETAAVETAAADAGTPAAGEQAPGIQTLSSADAKRLLEGGGVAILDIRTPQEWAGGRLKGAQLLNYYAPDFARQLQALDRSQSYLLYCAVGGRSREAARLMQQLGFQRVYDATEGFAGLKRAGVPLE